MLYLNINVLPSKSLIPSLSRKHDRTVEMTLKVIINQQKSFVQAYDM